MSLRTVLVIIIFGIAWTLPPMAVGQIADSADDSVADIPVNYTEARVGDYHLPDPLVLASGERVRDAEIWYQKRRPELLRLFEEHQFGRCPGRPEDLRFNVFEEGTLTLGGLARRKQVTVSFTAEASGPQMDVLVYQPVEASHAVPVLLYLSFTANNLAVDDPNVKVGRIWNRQRQRVPATGRRRFGGLNVRPFLEKGIAVATVYYGDIDPDFQGGLPHGVRQTYLKEGQSAPAANEWGAIAAWAWGLSRVLDYFETDAKVDATRVALMGVSRLGKTVLWAGARDPRFALVIASCSGEGGAALSRRNYGETIAHLTAPTRYPYQFCANYQRYGDRVNQFPVDAHLLIALMAPRPLLLQTGDRDKWSDPYGEFLAAVAAEPIYTLLGKRGLGTDQMPPADEAILNELGFLMHDGGHGTVPRDWEVFLTFLDKHLRQPLTE